MQTLYTISTEDKGDKESLIKNGYSILNEKLSRSLDLFALSIIYMLRAAQYAEIDAHQKASKYLPTAEDLSVNTKIAGNEFVWQVLSNSTFAEKIKEPRIKQYIDDEWVKKIYQKLAQTPEYKSYITADSRNPKEEKAIIQFLWEKLMLEDEGFNSYFTDELPGWEDDKEMTIVLMENFFKNSGKVNFLLPVSPEKKEYAQSLLRAVIDKEAYCMELIQPRLINWDAERVALIDLLLLRMGVCELLYFPTIPTKVTINEYIEIAKLYSTPQSGQFVNGVLDNILKDLVNENKIRKQERTQKP